MVTHIVLFKLSDPNPDTITATRDLLLSMDGKVPQLRHLEVGVDPSTPSAPTTSLS